jgi:hypothetical protein
MAAPGFDFSAAAGRHPLFAGRLRALGIKFILLL